ncbi:MAG: AraC family transcriptional regulator [Chloroflexi bacterium]|nr:AraC family transcriptional regulator [Chloroflexota bacterium]
MEKTTQKLQELGRLITHHTPEEGGAQTSLSNLVLFRSSEGQPRQHEVYAAYLLILVQGEKRLHIGGRPYDYKAGDYLAVFMPMLLEAERAEVPKDKPYLMACIEIDLDRIANLLLKLDRLTPSQFPIESSSAKGFHMAAMSDHLLDPVIRLLQTLENPRDIAILGEPIVDEIYYRLLCDEQVGFGQLRRHLEQRGQIQEIARAVNYIQTNLDMGVSVEKLAHVSNMSVSGFHRTFKEVMHTTPLQYAKTLKLHRARTLLHEGQTASEASLSVGYNSSAQFSREYKRFFGYPPSETRLAVH